MSGLARAVKKHWKRKVKTFKKYWKVAAIAVAAYFTFGLALGAMPAAGAAVGTTAAGAGAAATGAGVMSTTAAAAGAASAAAAGIETVTVLGAASGGLSAAGAAGAAATAGAAVAASQAGAGGGGASAEQPAVQPGTPQQPGAPQPKPSILDKAKGAWKDMSFMDKLLLAKAGVDVVSGLTAPTPEEEAAAAARWQGAFYGKTAAEAAGAPGVTQFVTPQTERQAAPATQGGRVGGRQIVPPQPTQQQQGQPMMAPAAPLKGAPTPEQTAQTPAPTTPQQVTDVGGNRDLFATRAPGVRYLV